MRGHERVVVQGLVVGPGGRAHVHVAAIGDIHLTAVVAENRGLAHGGIAGADFAQALAQHVCGRLHSEEVQQGRP